MTERAKTFKEVFPDTSGELTPEQIQFAKGGTWQADSRERHIPTPKEWDAILEQKDVHNDRTS